MFMDEKSTDHDDYYWMIKNSVVPRPIAWISSQSDEGVYNLAPYSFFNLVTLSPPLLQVCMTGKRDSSDNFRQNREWVVNLVSDGLAEQETMTAAILPPEVDEAAMAGLATTPSNLVSVPRLAAAKVALECVYDSEITVYNAEILFARIVGIYVDDAVLGENGRPDYAKYRPIGRMGGSGYHVAADAFDIKVPTAADLREVLGTPLV